MMPDKTTASPPPADKTPPRRHRGLRALKWIAGVIGVLILLLVLLAVLAVKTEPGARAVWQLATRMLPGQLSGEFVGGTLSDGISLRDVTYRDQSRIVKIDRMEGKWQLSRSPRALNVQSLRVGTADVTLLPTPDEPSTPPQQIRLPLAFDLERATVDKLIVHQDAQTTEYKDIRLNASSDKIHHKFNLENAETPYGTASASLSLDGEARPFPLSGAARLKGEYQDQPFTLDAALSGSLFDLGVKLNAAGEKLTGKAAIEATPFADLPFRSAQIDVSHLDPQVFNPDWPRADLDIHASLKPVDKAGMPASELAVSGPVSVTNAQPGALDQNLVPLESARADATLDRQSQQLSNLNVALAGGGKLEGSAHIRTGKPGGGAEGELSLQATSVDLHALHSALRPTQLSGPLTVDLSGETQNIAVDLKDPQFSVLAKAQLTPQQIAVENATLRSGPAELDVSGTLGRGPQGGYAVTGTLTDFNPALFLNTMQPAQDKKAKASPVRNINADINADFSAEGSLRPELSGKVQFDVYNSTYDGLPMTGEGRLQFAGTRILPSNVQLSVAGNEALLKGSFGTPSDRMNVNIDAPALNRLGFYLSGSLKVDGVVGGSLERPVIDATYSADNLVFGEQRLAGLSGEAHLRGVPGTDPDAKLQLDLNARGLRTDLLSLSRLDADIDGTYASHTINLDAVGQLRGEPINLDLSAQGQLQDRPQGMAWSGVLRTLENRGVPRVTMASPLPVDIAPDRIELGATRLNIAQSVIDLESLLVEPGLIRSEGSIDALNVARLLEIRQIFTGAAAPVATDLVLDGRWNFTVADRADGFVQIERRSGDVSIAGAAGQNPLGLSALSLRADLDGRQVNLAAQANAQRIGTLNGKGQILLQPGEQRLTLTPESPVSAQVEASIPRLQNIATFAGPSVALNGSMALDLSVDGVISDPIMSGMIMGDNLALTLYDQGVRLHDGTARIRLQNNLALLEQVEFHGGDGVLRITGQVPIGRNQEDLQADIVAKDLQLLASPTGRLTVSGQANATSVENQTLIAGKFTVDRARFTLPEKSAPQLDDDVVVIRGGKEETEAAEPGTQPAGPFAPRINIIVDLGNNFRFEGSGADLRLAGTVTIQSAPGEPPQAFGTVRIVDGTYEAFGTELAIERGIINFQGPLANPNISILAMRRQQEVAAGVQVTGTVRQPRVQLVSEPNVSEEEKLSWLIFGRGGRGTETGQAQSAARGAALGLLNKFGGSRIAQGLGLDELSIGSSEFGLAGGQQVVNLGKEISDRLTIGYEQSLAGAESILKLTYELTQHWSVVLRGGAVTGLDMFYSNRFDRIGERRKE